MDTTALKAIDQHIEQHVDDFIAVLANLVAVPSVAAQNTGIAECADLVASLLRDHGHTAEVMPSKGNPVVYSEGGAGSKTMMFYNHYDVQPAEPLDLWDSPPFELTRKGNFCYGRGISDDKGHLVARLAALAAVQHTLGQLPCRVKFVVEGEEEVGSPSIFPFVEQHREKLAADACIWEFGAVDHEERPVHFLGMRGITYVQLAVKTADMDAHSGLAGSAFHNAAWRLTWALATLKGQDERILIPGYYDNVRPASARDLELLANLPDESATWTKTYGLKRGFLNGMTAGPELRRASVFEPTCTICGITTGYQGPGSKTVLPAEATAKVDFRTVPDQTPQEVVDKLRKHLDDQGFDDVVIAHWDGEPPARTDPDDPFIQMSINTAEDAFGKPPLVWPMVGGSGPIHAFVHTLGLPVTMTGLGYPDTRAHAPNENIRIDHFIKAVKHTARVLLGFSEM